MVCKDDVFLWFKNLEAWKRIDVICGLLNMFCSFELRYFNSYLENLYNKSDFIMMDDLQKKANNPEEISKLKSFENTSVRSRLVVYLTFLQSKNQECSNIIFDYVNKYLNVNALKDMGILDNKDLEEEVLLLLKLAINHPAFSFTQIHDLNELFENIQKFISKEKPNSEIILNYSQSNEALRPSYFDELSTNVNLINSLETQITCLKAFPLPNTSNFSCFQILVELKDGKSYEIIKMPKQLLNFHQQLTHHFEEDIVSSGLESCLDDSLKDVLQNDSFDLKVNEKVNVYLKHLLYLPLYILESKVFTQFFEFNNEVIPRGQVPNESAKAFPESNHHEVKSCTFYNSLISSCKDFHKSQSRQSNSDSLPQTRFITTNSYDPILQVSEELNWLQEQLAEYSDKFGAISSLKELHSLNLDDLGSMGFDQHMAGKIMSIIESSRLKLETNSIPKHITNTKATSFFKPTSKSNGSNESLNSEVSSSTSQSSEEEKLCSTQNKTSSIASSVPSLVAPYNFIHPMFLKQNLMGGSKYIHNNPHLIDHTGPWNYHPTPPTMPLCYHQASIPPPTEMANNATSFTNLTCSTSNLGAKEKGSVPSANSFNYQSPNSQCVCNAPSPYYRYISVNLHPHFNPNYPGYPIPMEMFYPQHPPPHIQLGTPSNSCSGGVNSNSPPSNSNLASSGSPLSPSNSPPATISASISNGSSKGIICFNCGKNRHLGCDCIDPQFDITQTGYPNTNYTSFFEPNG